MSGQRPNWEISIHALLAESDADKHVPPPTQQDFYPRSPCGERLHYDNYNLHCTEISIHALLAESDRFQAADISARRISIHALLAESDLSALPGKAVTTRDFYPRSPCGERPS